ncbi:MAG: hypothetical protein NZ742_09785 [Acidobacteria bacterium]|nr:hypothetical protein [Acidobacteriota bacterium]MDW7985103.1 hypothetical protein [Acidobacteriota bacterium]
MQDTIYQESVPVMSNTQDVIFRVPADRVPRATAFYWQVFWVDRPQDNPAWALTEVVETRIAMASDRPTAVTPADDDEVPADLLRFVVEPKGAFARGPVDYGFCLSRQPQLQTIDYAWQISQPTGPVDFRPAGVLPEGTWYAGFYTVRRTDTQVLISELVVHRFRAIPPCRTWNQGVYAVRVVASDLRCTDTSWYQSPHEALGPPNAQALGPPDQFLGIVSLGIDGSVTVEMGRCISDGPGMDLRVYQAVSNEGVEVQVSQSRAGPWISLGWDFCGEPTSGLFSGYCDFDLAWGGLSPVRFLRIIDRQRYSHPGSTSCTDWNVNPRTPGADIDAVQSLR